jgi:hypothetical protein
MLVTLGTPNYGKSIGSVSCLLGLLWRCKTKHAARRASIAKEHIGCVGRVRFAAVNPTYLPTVLLERVTDFQLVKKFLAFYGTRRLITAFTCVRHLSLF